MTLLQRVTDRLPRYVPTSTIRVTESHEFDARGDDTPKTVYTIRKSPFEELRTVEAQVGGLTRELTVGVDVETRDTTGDGNPDSIAFLNKDTYPDDGTVFEVEYVVYPIIARYTDSLDTDIDTVGYELDEAVLAKYVGTAEGDELDRLGAMFGVIGKRSGRSDEVYRIFLRSLVASFNANGSVPDIRFAVAAALGIDESDITIREDYQRTGFEVIIQGVSGGAVTSSLSEIIDLAKPSGVELTDLPRFTGGEITLNASTSSSDTFIRGGISSLTISQNTIG